MRTKRWLALLLAAVMMITSVNVTELKSYAEEISDVSDGSVNADYEDSEDIQKDVASGEEEGPKLVLDANGGYFYDEDISGNTMTEKSFTKIGDQEINVRSYRPAYDDKHYKFMGWYDARTGGKLMENPSDPWMDFYADIDEDTTWYAHWEKKYKTLTMDSEGGLVTYRYPETQYRASSEKVTFSVDTDGITILGEFVGTEANRPGKAFLGWYLNGREFCLNDSRITSDTTIVARYDNEYTVTLDCGVGYYCDYSVVPSVKRNKLECKVMAGFAVDWLENPECDEGYSFAGWYLSTDTEHKDSIDLNSFFPDSDVTLVALWEKNCKVTFNAGEGEFLDGKTVIFYVEKGKPFSSNAYIPYVSCKGKTLAGWYEDGGLTGPISEVAISNRIITEDVTFYAGFDDTCTVIFSPNGGHLVFENDLSANDISANDPNEPPYMVEVAKSALLAYIVPVADSDSDSLVFSGWYLDKECSGEPVDVYAYSVENDVTLYAGWTECYKLTFHTNYEGATFKNGKDTLVVKVPKGSAFRYTDEINGYRELNCTPKITDLGGGHLIPGWYSDPECEGAKYIFNAGSEVYIVNGDEIKQLGGLYGFVPTEDMDFYANITSQTVKITFNANGAKFDEDEILNNYTEYPGELSNDKKKWTITVPKGITYGEVTLPYQFDWDSLDGREYEWGYSDSKCKKRIDSEKKITSNLTVYLKLFRSEGNFEDEFQITLNACEGYFQSTNDDYEECWVTADPQVWHEVNVPIIDDEERIFTGWYLDKDLKKPYPEEYQKFEYAYGQYRCYIIVPGEISDLYAKYENAVTFTFNANGGYFDYDSNRATFPTRNLLENTALTAKTRTGESVVVSDYVKRIRRDDNKVFAGWYWDPECTRRADIYAVDQYAELCRPTSVYDTECNLYAKWVDYKEPKLGCPYIGNPELKLKETTGVSCTNSGPYTHYIIGKYTGDRCPIELGSYRGTIRAVAPGECTIYAECCGVISESATITVYELINSSESFEIKNGKNNVYEDSTLEVLMDEELILTGTVYGDTFGVFLPYIQWESSDESVVTIASLGGGKVKLKPVSAGDAEITVTFNEKTKKFSVSVEDPLSTSVTALTMTAGKGAQVRWNLKVLDEVTLGLSPVSQYANEDLTNYASYVGLSYGTNLGDDQYREMYVNAEPTGTAGELTKPVTVYLCVKGTYKGKECKKVCALTINPLPDSGSVTASIPSGSTVIEGTQILLAPTIEGADIYYSFDDTEPRRDYSGTVKYNDAILIGSHKKINAIAYKEGCKVGKPVSFTYKIKDSDNWGDAAEYGSLFGVPSAIPSGMWYVIGDRILTDKEKFDNYEFDDSDLVYTGSKITFDDKIKVFFGKTRLIQGTDYTLSYANNTNYCADPDKAATVTVKGKGRYSGKVTIRFNIAGVNINNAVLTSAPDVCVTAGAKVKLSSVKPSLMYNGKKLVEKKDYDLIYYDADENVVPDPQKVMLKTAEASYKIEVVGKGNYLPVSYKTVINVSTVDKNNKNIVDLGKTTVTDRDGNALKLSYDGTAITAETLDLLFDNREDKVPTFVVKIGKTELTYGVDFKVAFAQAYEDTASIGKYQLVVTPAKNAYIGGETVYAGSKNVTLEITGRSISGFKVGYFKTKVDYTGKSITLEDLFDESEKKISVTGATEPVVYSSKKNGKKTEYTFLEKGKDYEVKFIDNYGQIGKFSVEFVGINEYTGKISKKVTVNAFDFKNVGKAGDVTATLKNPGSVVYSKAGAKPEVVVKHGDRVLTEGIDYTVSYKNNTKLAINYLDLKESARPTVIIKGKGNYKGTSKTLYFSIKRAKLADAVELAVSDVTYKANPKSGYYLVKPKFTDSGKAVTVGWNKDIDDIDSDDYEYRYVVDTTLNSGEKKWAGEIVSPDDKLKEGTVIELSVTVRIMEYDDEFRTKQSPYYATGKGYSQEYKAYYRVTGTSTNISKATAKIKTGVTFSYKNGALNVPLKSTDIEVYFTKNKKKQYLTEDDYEIVSVTNGILPGTATVTIKGKKFYSGTKKFTFKIDGKDLKCDDNGK